MAMKHSTFLLLGTAATALGALAFSSLSSQPSLGPEPIAYIGHGAFFDSKGNQIIPSAEFLEQAQNWYQVKLEAGLSEKSKIYLRENRDRLFKGLDLDRQSKLVAQQAILGWMLDQQAETLAKSRIPGKIALIESLLAESLPDPKVPKDDKPSPFKISQELLEQLPLFKFIPKAGQVSLATTNGGQDYLDECSAAKVPIPPPINRMATGSTAGWSSRGFIPRSQQFIVGSPAELRTFSDTNGLCIALPRYNETDANLSTNETSNVRLDGVICMSRITSKVCFWDNQMPGTHPPSPPGPPIPPGPAIRGIGFSFSAGTQIPIGVPDLAVNSAGLYQAGGAEIEYGSGGVCTDCHAGENPFIIHPNADIAVGSVMEDVSEMPPAKYIPIVGGSWPQNLLSQSPALVPPGCTSCHTQGDAGRIPHLYDDPAIDDEQDTLEGYCSTILTGAAVGISRRALGMPMTTMVSPPPTMPQFNPGSLSTNSMLATMRAYCQQPLSAGPSNRGDPHLITTNGVNYDFQAAGEFVSLRNSAIGFEMQTRQTPVPTDFVPGPNPYTGLASCVSLNTAIALRLGKHRVSFQPTPQSSSGKPPIMELRIDGGLVSLPATGIALGDGNRIDPIGKADGIKARASDGSLILITNNFWASQNHWYLNVEVVNSPAREGTMGTILPANWLPLGPSAVSFGPAPVNLASRFTLLNQTFANAWRVRSRTSLFDYSPGTSTQTFVDHSWPAPVGSVCPAPPKALFIPAPKNPENGRLKPAIAMRQCAKLKGTPAFNECIFDVSILGDAGIPAALARSVMARQRR